MPRGLDKKTLKLKQGDKHGMVRGNLPKIVWKDKQEMHILTYMHTIKKRQLCDKQGKAQNLPLLQAAISK
jgi:hypothetical protein